MHIQINHHVACPSHEEDRVIKVVGVHKRSHAWGFVAVAITASLLITSGCNKQDPYAPPDLFYYFASYKVGKNPTTVTPTDVNQDGFTDLLTRSEEHTSELQSR